MAIPEESSCASSLYADIRSLSRPHTRSQKAKQKYYGYRGVRPSQVGQPFLSFPDPPHSERRLPNMRGDDPLLAMPDKAKVRVWTKRDMFDSREDNIWPLDRRHHRGRVARGRGWGPPVLDHRRTKRLNEDMRWEVEDPWLFDWLNAAEEDQRIIAEYFGEKDENDLDLPVTEYTKLVGLAGGTNGTIIKVGSDVESEFDMLVDDTSVDTVSDDGWDIVSDDGWEVLS